VDGICSRSRRESRIRRPSHTLHAVCFALTNIGCGTDADAERPSEYMLVQCCLFGMCFSRSDSLRPALLEGLLEI